MLKSAAEELKWQDKKIIFARRGHLGCILSHTRLCLANKTSWERRPPLPAESHKRRRQGRAALPKGPKNFAES